MVLTMNLTYFETGKIRYKIIADELKFLSFPQETYEVREINNTSKSFLPENKRK